MIEDIHTLRDICQEDKRKTNEGLTLQNRNVSLYLTRFLLKFPVTADFVSYSSIITGIVAASLFLSPSSLFIVIGALMLYLSFCLDQTDGEVARYRNTVSVSGAYIDEIRHLLIYSVPMFCLSFHCYWELQNPFLFLLGFAAAMSLCLDRINQKIDGLIYVDKIILKSNFSKGNLETDNVSTLLGYKESNYTNQKPNIIKRLLKSILGVFYSFKNIVCHQVNIIIIILITAIIDIITEGFRLNIGVSFVSVFFLAFSVITPPITVRDIYSKHRCRDIEKRCKEIHDKIGTLNEYKRS